MLRRGPLHGGSIQARVAPNFRLPALCCHMRCMLGSNVKHDLLAALSPMHDANAGLPL